LALACSESSSNGAAPPGDASDAACPSGVQKNGPYSKVSIVGNAATKGAFDPSVAYRQGAASGLMTYTAVPDEAHVHIAIATSADAGESWQYAADVTQAMPITISATDDEVCGAATCDGFWVHESSSLVVDPSDPDETRRLKVFAHGYFFDSGGRDIALGHLAMFTAATPSGPWTETKLFGWPSSSPVSNEGVRYDIRSDPSLEELHDCFIVAEPGALFREPDTIDLTLSCVKVAAAGATIEVRLLRSKDHGQSWSFVSTLLTPEDGLALGSTTPRANGSALLHANERYYVIMSPDGEVAFPGGVGSGYRGCVVVPIADIENGRVERCDGMPVIASAYLGEPMQFVGACSADVGASKSGMLVPVPDFSNPASIEYRILAAGLPLP
jgi:hypothetical protein